MKKQHSYKRPLHLLPFLSSVPVSFLKYSSYPDISEESFQRKIDIFFILCYDEQYTRSIRIKSSVVRGNLLLQKSLIHRTSGMEVLLSARKKNCFYDMSFHLLQRCGFFQSTPWWTGFSLQNLSENKHSLLSMSFFRSSTEFFQSRFYFLPEQLLWWGFHLEKTITKKQMHSLRSPQLWNCCSPSFYMLYVD